MSDRCKNCGAEQDDHYDGVQCPLGQGLYSTENSFQRVGEVEWRVSPQVFSDIHTSSPSMGWAFLILTKTCDKPCLAVGRLVLMRRRWR